MIFKLHCEKEKFSNLLASSEVEALKKFTDHAMFKIAPGQRIEMPLSMFLDAFSSMYRTLVYEATQHDRVAARLAIHETIVSLLKFVDAIHSTIMLGYMMVWECDQ
uniref:Uncharacterized protein n=1 Tax=Pseudomonas phage HRDY3 TaxID=3236930 RepID=A0AB39CEN3_9VIRU